jgi:hypothetical protein
MADNPSGRRTNLIKADLLLGAVIMGTTCGAIAYYLGGPPAAVVLGILIGSLLGGLISTLGARPFFLSVLVGTLLGGIIAREYGGSEMLVIGAGSGAAIGGFVGVNIELFRRKPSAPPGLDDTGRKK